MTWNDPFRNAFANNIQISELRPQLEVVAFEVGTGGGNGPHQVHLVVGPNQHCEHFTSFVRITLGVASYCPSTGAGPLVGS